ncbi:uncharacterized protein LOC129601852 [Paramacrobiotus metropolitanus]|uniref:uncharacterized protein LOC129601852 n=1 Tax=Paramacrobiotus metropolitanus TaxID=2943436 RepID=UPI0024460753|nr:uncharacterized protein LOC129601852 [Paramacrobiotus metropolitanus]
MCLQGYGRGPGFRRFPLPVLPPQMQIIRAPEGGTLLVYCNNTNGAQVPQAEVPPAFTYNGRLVSLANPTLAWIESEELHCCNGTTKTSHGDIVARPRFTQNSWRASEYQRATGAFSIVLEHFNDGHSGVYECLHSNGSQLVVTQRYYVSAIRTALNRHNVFDPPMKNLTVRYGRYAEMVCAVRFNFLPGSLNTRFLWRNGGHLLMTDSMPQVAGKTSAWRASTGTFMSALMDAGLYECWFRINDRLDEWIMQEAYLHVI